MRAPFLHLSYRFDTVLIGSTHHSCSRAQNPRKPLRIKALGRHASPGDVSGQPGHLYYGSNSCGGRSTIRGW